MKGGKSDKFRVSASSLSLLLRHFPDKTAKTEFMNKILRPRDMRFLCLGCLQLLEDELLVVFSKITAYLHDVVVEIVEIQYVEEEILVCEQFQKEIAF